VTAAGEQEFDDREEQQREERRIPVGVKTADTTINQ
jgi:hypothetical protein